MSILQGEEIVGYFVPETTYGDKAKPTAAKGLRTSSLVITPVYDRPFVPERRNTRSRQERVDGKKSATWALRCVVRPSDTAGTAPDCGDILKHAYGTETVVGSTSVAYTLLKDPSALSASIYKHLEDLQEMCYGAIVQSVGVTFGGEDFAMFEFSGVAQDVGEAGKNQANGTGSSTDVFIVDDSDFFKAGGIVQIDGDDNSGAGFQIGSIISETLYLDTAHSWSNDDAVIPFAPTATLAGSPRYGTVGQISLDGDSTTVQIISGSFNMATGLGLHTSQFGTQNPQAVTLEGERTCDFSVDMLVEDTEVFRMGHARSRVSQNVIITIGDTAGKRMKIKMPTAEIDPGARSGEDGLMRVSLSGVALASSSGEDEHSLMFD